MSSAIVAAVSAALGGTVRLTGSRRNLFTSSARSDILFFRRRDGTLYAVLLKRSHAAEGRGSAERIAYEAAIYEHLLRPEELDTPRFIAAGRDGDTRWLAIERIERAQRIRFRGVPTFRRAARWLGAFHRISRARQTDFARVLRRETLDDILEPVERLQAAGRTHPLPARIARLLAWFRARGARMLVEAQAPAHGEFYPGNVLVAQARIRTVDWECAAIGSSERDLAMLTEGWEGAQRARLEDEYAIGRWGNPSLPDDVRMRLDAERFHLACIGLAEHVIALPAEPLPDAYLQMAANAAERLGAGHAA